MDPAEFYSGIVVDAYALLKSSSFSPDPYAAFVEAHGEPALEIGCGDGEPMLDLCSRGLEVDGVDSSADMVARCRQNATRRGLTVEVFHQRAESLSLARSYGSIYFAGPTFNLIPDDESALAALDGIRCHLEPGGAALIPLWVPAATPPENLGIARTAIDSSGADSFAAELRYTPTSEIYDAVARTRTTISRCERVTTDHLESVDREWVIHWHTPAGFRALCERAGLAIVSMTDDSTGEPAGEAATEFTAIVTHS